MEPRLRPMIVYPSFEQKKKLMALISQHPQLISSKKSKDFTTKDSHNLWGQIAAECNAIPGAKKTWRQWKKTWQDIRAKAKKKQQGKNGEFPKSIKTMTSAEIEALGLKNVSSTTNYQDTIEFVTPEEEVQELTEDQFTVYTDTESYIEPASPTDVKADVLSLTHPQHNPSINTNKKVKNNITSGQSDSCMFNCELLAVQEQRKIQIKEDYLNFKKDYLRQKLMLMKEQTEALKGIAKGLAK